MGLGDGLADLKGTPFATPGDGAELVGVRSTALGVEEHFFQLRSGPICEVVRASSFESRPLGDGASVSPGVVAADLPLLWPAGGARPPTTPGTRTRSGP
jgi:hypothetical protein